MTVTEHIRHHLWHKLVPAQLDYGQLVQTEWSSRFERYMRNRLLVGAYRYAPLRHGGNWDTMSSIRARAQLYRQTGNQELLVDIANLALVEFCRPSQTNTYFKAVDDGPHVEELCVSRR